MRPPFEFLFHLVGGTSVPDVDATLARLGTQGWTIAGVSTIPDGRTLVALQRPYDHEDAARESELAVAAESLAAPLPAGIEGLPALELSVPTTADDPRDALVAALERYVPATPDEAADRAAIIAYMKAEPRALERDCPAGHLTASAFIVDRERSATVLVHHAALDRWLQPGGHWEPGDAGFAAAALREAREETALTSLRAVDGAIFDVDVHEIPARGGQPAHRHFDVRVLVEADRDEMPRANGESHAVAWVALADVAGRSRDESVIRLGRKAQCARDHSEGAKFTLHASNAYQPFTETG